MFSKWLKCNLPLTLTISGLLANLVESLYWKTHLKISICKLKWGKSCCSTIIISNIFHSPVLHLLLIRPTNNEPAATDGRKKCIMFLCRVQSSTFVFSGFQHHVLLCFGFLVNFAHFKAVGLTVLQSERSSSSDFWNYADISPERHFRTSSLYFKYLPSS